MLLASLKNFSLAILHNLSFYTDISKNNLFFHQIVQGVCSCFSLFPLQGALVIADVNSNVHQNFSKVKNFFQSFLIFSSFAFGKLSFPSAANSFSLSHLHLFVKNFFRGFSKFFVPDSHPMCFPRVNAPLYYHPLPRLSTLFSPFFRLFLCLLSLVLISAPDPKM